MSRTVEALPIENEMKLNIIHDRVDEAYERMINNTYKVVIRLVLEGYEADEALREALRRTGW